MRIPTAIVVVLQFLLLAGISHAGPATVGNLGETTRFQFSGNETFSSNQIRSELGANLDVLLACHPDAPRDELLNVIQQRVRDGYLQSGFADVKVAVRLTDNGSTVLITIHEGPRYRCSDIEIVGATTLQVGRLRTLLTSTRLESTTPVKFSEILWKVGTPASFSAGYWESKHEAFRKELEFLGYHDAHFTLESRADVDGKATLVISILDEGPQAVLGDIEVVGTEKNSPEDVIQYLELQSGSVLDADVKSQIEQKLSNSARFLKHEVKIIAPFGNGPSTLRIKLVEYPEAPALTAPLTEKEQAAVRLAQWINTFESTGNDFDGEFVYPLDPKLKYEVEPPVGALIAHWRMVISHRQQACLLRFRLFEYQGREWLDLWGQLTPKVMEFMSPQQGLKYQARGLSQSVLGTIQWTAQPPDKEGRMAHVLFGVGIKSNSEHRYPPFTLQTTAAPVAALREVHRDEWQLQDGQLKIDDDKYHAEIDAKTGRLMRLELAQGPACRMTAICAPDRHQKMVDEYDRLSEKARVIEAGDVPISNLLTFLATCIPERSIQGNESRATKLATLGHSLLKRGAFHAFDELVLDFYNPNTEIYWIPPESKSQTKKNPPASWTVMVLPYANKILPTPSWPQSLIRELVFALSGRTSRTEESIRTMLSDPASGPVANMASAYAFGFLSPQLRIEFARRGLSRLDRERFLWDCEPLFRDGTAFGRLLTAVAQTLQDVDVQELNELVSELPLNDAERQALARALRQFPSHRSDRPMEALRAAIDDAWEPLIEPHIGALLEMLAH